MELERSTEKFSEGALDLELRRDGSAIQVLWSGRSTAREPGPFILKVLGRAIDLSTAEEKPLILDFQNVRYMNSSSITPVIRVLDRAKRGANRVRLLYRRDLKWQELSFSALEVFQTVDRRIEIWGV